MEILDFCTQKLQKQDCDKFEIYWEKSAHLGIDIRDAKLDHCSRSVDEGLAIRVLKNQKMGFAYSFDLSQPAIERMITTACQVAELMPSDEFNDLPSHFEANHYPHLLQVDEKGLAVDLKAKIELAQSLEAEVLKKDSRIKRVRQAGLDQYQHQTVLIDTHGKRITHSATHFQIGVLCVAEQNANDAVMGADSFTSCFYHDLNRELVINEAAQSALALLNAKMPNTMTCPAVFKNSIVAELVGFLADSFSAESIDKNFSMLVNKRGQAMFSKQLTLLHDPLLKNAAGSRPFDAEGVPSKATTLINQGVVEAYLYNHYYAKKHQTTSTSNSSRGSLKSPPSIGTSNLFLKPGQDNLAQLIQQAHQGIFITELMGLHTANPITGEFSVGASGILIENGQLTQAVKGFAIAGNLIDLLKNVAAVGSDLRFWGSIGSPSLLVSQLAVSGS